MNERKNNRQAKTEKDYYFPVILSQVLCCSVLVGLFFFVRGGSGWQQLSEKYSSLLQEDFLTVEFSSVVSGMKEYLLEGSASFAVNGNRVEPYVNEDVTENNDNTSVTEEEPEKAIDTPEATTATNETSADTAVQTMSSGVNAQTVPLKLEYKKKSNMTAPLEDGVYTSYFGERTDPIAGDEDYHKGIDIAADEGEPIKAVFDGIVSAAGEDERSGKYVFLEHGKGIVTLYCHCSEIIVGKGERIKQGETIALVGSTGYSTGPHLHFEVRMNGESIDPLPLLENAD